MSTLLALLLLSCAFPDAKSIGQIFNCNGHKYVWDGAWKAAKPEGIPADNVFTWRGPSVEKPADCQAWKAEEADGHCQVQLMFGESTKNLACMIENDGYTVKCVWDKPKKEKE